MVVATAYSQFIDPPRLGGPVRAVSAGSQSVSTSPGPGVRGQLRQYGVLPVLPD